MNGTCFNCTSSITGEFVKIFCETKIGCLGYGRLSVEPECPHIVTLLEPEDQHHDLVKFIQPSHCCMYNADRFQRSVRSRGDLIRHIASARRFPHSRSYLTTPCETSRVLRGRSCPRPDPPVLRRPNQCTIRRASLPATRHDPTIYALSTAPGRAAIAIVRISGPACTKVILT